MTSLWLSYVWIGSPLTSLASLSSLEHRHPEPGSLGTYSRSLKKVDIQAVSVHMPGPCRPILTVTTSSLPDKGVVWSCEGDGNTLSQKTQFQLTITGTFQQGHKSPFLCLFSLTLIYPPPSINLLIYLYHYHLMSPYNVWVPGTESFCLPILL